MTLIALVGGCELPTILSYVLFCAVLCCFVLFAANLSCFVLCAAVCVRGGE